MAKILGENATDYWKEINGEKVEYDICPTSQLKVLSSITLMSIRNSSKDNGTAKLHSKQNMML